MENTLNSKIKLLISKAKKIAEVIGTDDPTEENVFESIIDFILILEHVLKSLIYDKNKLLIYNFNPSDNDQIVAILEKKDKSIFTIELSVALLRYFKIFPSSKLVTHGESLEILIKNRNQLEHGIEQRNMQSRDELIGILTSVFPDFLIIAEEVLGKLPPTKKPKKEKVYSEKDIQDIYEGIVLSKIGGFQNNLHNFYSDRLSNISSPGMFSLSGEQCPRCSRFSLSKRDDSSPFISRRSLTYNLDSDIYVCASCNLELTEREYKAALKLKGEGKLKNSPFGL
jgi:hypothetical protein